MSKAKVWLGDKLTELEFEPGKLACDVLTENGINVARPCGGRGTCGKCAFEATGELSPETDAEKRFSVRLCCQTRLMGNAEIILKGESCIEQIETETGSAPESLMPMSGSIGAAVDIGTTTMALKLYDLTNGICIATSSMLNPQTSIASDVMGRIEYALKGGTKTLRDQVKSAIETLISKAQELSELSHNVDSLVITGNTTMLYLLTGRNPQSLSRAPFEADCLFDETIDLFGCSCYLPPCMNAFVGADITCAILSCGMCKRDETALLCDIGTNGEIALWHRGKLYVTSTAAGPAFEGAGISSGVGSVLGAIDKVWVQNNSVGARTIGGVKAVGICGSGLIDAVAALLQIEEIDDTGAMQSDFISILDCVGLNKGDIRAVQLAKAAIAAGIVTLAQSAGVSIDDIEKVYIAGGFGSHLNVNSAIAIGLVPSQFKDKVNVVGNAALAGGVEMLLNVEKINEAREIAILSQHVNLGGNPVFNENYLDQMFFPSQY